MPDLSDLCARGGRPRPKDGEEIEAYAEGSRHVQVRVRGGEVESLTSAETRGLGRSRPGGRARGLRVRRRPDARGSGRPGRGAPGRAPRSPRPTTPTAFPDLTPPDPLPGMFREALERVPAERKVALALEVERAATAVAPRRRARSSRPRSPTRSPAPPSRRRAAGRWSSRGPTAGCRCRRWPSGAARRRAGSTSRWRASWTSWTGRRRARSAAERAARLLGGEKPAQRAAARRPGSRRPGRRSSLCWRARCRARPCSRAARRWRRSWASPSRARP